MSKGKYLKSRKEEVRIQGDRIQEKTKPQQEENLTQSPQRRREILEQGMLVFKPR